MKFLDRCERKLESAVDGGFARGFGGKVAPQEIEQSLQREAEATIENLGDGARLVANSYVVSLSPSDLEHVATEYELNRKIFSRHLEDFIRDNGWQTYGPVVVEFDQIPSLHTGQFHTDGVVNPDATPRPVPATAAAPGPASHRGAPVMTNPPGNDQGGQYPGYPQQGGQYPQYDYDQQQYDPAQGGYAQPGYDQQQPAYDPQAYGQQPGYDQGYAAPADQGYAQPGYDQQQYAAPADQGYAPAPGYAPTGITLVLEDGSNRTFALRHGSNVLGRGQDAQFRLPDTGVSRRHAEIRWDGQKATLTDLNSTNGTTVNDLQVSAWELANGDRIRLGHSDITVRFQ